MNIAFTDNDSDTSVERTQVGNTNVETMISFIFEFTLFTTQLGHAN